MPLNDVAEFIGGPRDGDQITLPTGSRQVVVALGLSVPDYRPDEEPAPPSAQIRTGVYEVRQDHGLRARRRDGIMLLDWRGER